MAVEADDACFEAFAEAVRQWLRHEAYGMCGDWHEADDLVQTALWKIYRLWPRLCKQGGLRAYARQVVVTSLLTERRRSRWRHELLTSVIIEAGYQPAAQDAVEDRTVLAAAMSQLGERQRTVLSMRFFRDLSVEQTARALGCTPGTVTSQTVRALKRLRQVLS
ncbi:RNA polymerase sigma-E factor [Actinoplanes sp. SE50]|uniref:RNA polymerase sigma factor n=1 Tax=unclassified Actinoplanes TaxID=2626549 RepID=UPI00023ED4F9|nr:MULTISPECIES: sigma-70 family RNA polymerase sigma factor [unclassified Actinoplanes]AEV87864.1 RNA polymerase sigma-E factor [Actinoplanes sp. SE50/110]ATO86266.1 RNA polymerase sigma-E factor [Actinoplanes sp. SE50]SLM03681.1 RNA polymerase sigma-E factor [Actinoplanes sp. SE50/110]